MMSSERSLITQPVMFSKKLKKERNATSEQTQVLLYVPR